MALHAAWCQRRSKNGHVMIVLESTVLLVFGLSIILWVLSHKYDATGSSTLFSWDTRQGAPWLSGVVGKKKRYSTTDLLTLAKMRAKRRSKYNTITVIHVAGDRMELLQNCVYSLVVNGRADNYIIAAMDNIELCQSLGLPCADVSRLFSESSDTATTVAQTFNSPWYKQVTRAKVIVVDVLLRHGFAVHSSDFDVYYAKDVWKNYLSYMMLGDSVTADAAFQKEWGYVNTGNYVILPTTAAKLFMARWLERMNTPVPEDNDQLILAGMLGENDVAKNGFQIVQCMDVEECLSSSHDRTISSSGNPNSNGVPTMLIRSFDPPYSSSYHDHCIFGKPNHPDFPFDMCHPSLLFAHTICTVPSGSDSVYDVKLKTLIAAGAWAFDSCDEQGEDATMRCTPKATPQSCLPDRLWNPKAP